MDLRRQRFDRAAPADEFAVLMVGVAARQAASPAAAKQARLVVAPAPAASLLCPPNGAFNGATAAALATWRNE